MTYGHGTKLDDDGISEILWVLKEVKVKWWADRGITYYVVTNATQTETAPVTDHPLICKCGE